MFGPVPLTKEEQALLEFSQLTGMYKNCRWPPKLIRTKVLKRSLAPIFKPSDKRYTRTVNRECEICFNFFPGHCNATVCCRKDICTECYVQIQTPTLEKPCPFCNKPKFTVKPSHKRLPKKQTTMRPNTTTKPTNRNENTDPNNNPNSQLNENTSTTIIGNAAAQAVSTTSTTNNTDYSTNQSTNSAINDTTYELPENDESDFQPVFVSSKDHQEIMQEQMKVNNRHTITEADMLAFAFPIPPPNNGTTSSSTSLEHQPPQPDTSASNSAYPISTSPDTLSEDEQLKLALRLSLEQHKLDEALHTGDTSASNSNSAGGMS